MTILLIGSDGTLGTSLQKKAPAWAAIKPWTAVDCDLSHPETLPAALDVVEPDIIINAAAYTDVDGAEERESLATAINGIAVGAMALYAAERKLPIVHYSTDYVFSGTSADGYTEHSTPDPINAYGRSKLKGEQQLEASGCEYLCVRTSRLFGHAAAKHAKKNFVDRMLELSTEKNALSIVQDERTSPTFADDLASATYELIKSGKRGLFHRTNDESCTWFEFAEEIFSIAGKTGLTLTPVAGSTFPRPARRPACSTLKSTKLPPLRSWQEALRDYMGGVQ